jgi:pilus assembly protein CpaB
LKKIRIIAIISAIITALAVYIYLAGMKKPVEVKKFPVVVASMQILEGQEIKEDMVTVKMLPAEAIVDKAATSLGDIVGRISSATVEPGEQLLVSRFFKSGETSSGLAIAIEKGKRAITVAVDPVSGVAGLINPRDNVDILLVIGVTEATASPDGSAPKTTVISKLLLQNIKVLATGKTIVPGGEASDAKTVDTITLSVTPEQALKLNFATSEGKIRLVLRSPIDSDEPDVSVVDINAVLE